MNTAEQLALYNDAEQLKSVLCETRTQLLNQTIAFASQLAQVTAQRDALAKQLADLRAACQWSATALANGELLPSQRISAALDYLRVALERSKP